MKTSNDMNCSSKLPLCGFLPTFKELRYHCRRPWENFLVDKSDHEWIPSRRKTYLQIAVHKIENMPIDCIGNGGLPIEIRLNY